LTDGEEIKDRAKQGARGVKRRGPGKQQNHRLKPLTKYGGKGRGGGGPRSPGDPRNERNWWAGWQEKKNLYRVQGGEKSDSVSVEYTERERAQKKKRPMENQLRTYRAT